MKRTKLRGQINNIIMEKLLDTGVYVTIITLESWHPNWSLQEADVQFLGIGALLQIKWSMRWVECIGPEGWRGRLRPFESNIVVKLWCCDLLQQRNTQINISAFSEIDCKPTHDIIRYYINRN